MSSPAAGTADWLKRRAGSVLGVLDANLLARELGAVEALQGAGGVVGVELDEREAFEDANRPDRVVGNHCALDERPANVVFTEAAARPAVDEELDLAVARGLGRRLRRRLGVPGRFLGLNRLGLGRGLAPDLCRVLASPRPRRMFQPL